MNCLVILSVALMSLFSSPTKSYITYTIQGDVKLISRNQSVRLSPGEQIDEKAILTIGQSGKIVLLCEQDKSLITLQSQGTGTVSSMIGRQGNKSSSVTADYISFIKNKISAKDNVKAVNYMQSAGTSYRNYLGRYAPLPEAEPGHLLDPLRDVCRSAILAFKDNDVEGLEQAAHELESLGICRYNFDLLSDYRPRSFNGEFVLDPLCLRDLALSVDLHRPFSEQIGELPMPITATTNNIDAGGNILANYYYLEAGEQLAIVVDCVGYCEIAVLSSNNHLETTFNGSGANNATFDDVEAATIIITNLSSEPASLLLAINAE